MLIPIRIIPLSPVSIELISSIIMPLYSVFHTEISVDKPLLNAVGHAFDDSRAQYNSTEIIRYLIGNTSAGRKNKLQNISIDEHETKILGITAVDLFVPILTYVFGEAQLDGTTCVVSTYRLDETIYGFPADPVLFFERTLKETVHELGHTYGLYHCRNLECAMHASTAVEDIDQKGATLCGECRKMIGL